MGMVLENGMKVIHATKAAGRGQSTRMDPDIDLDMAQNDRNVVLINLIYTCWGKNFWAGGG